MKDMTCNALGAFEGLDGMTRVKCGWPKGHDRNHHHKYMHTTGNIIDVRWSDDQVISQEQYDSLEPNREEQRERGLIA